MDRLLTERRGFTLIEVVIAVLILSMAIVASLATYGSEIRALAQARETAVAIELAEDRIAAVRLFAQDQLPNLPDSLEEGVFEPPYEVYRWEAEARTVSGQDLAEVGVVVRWPTGEHRLATVVGLPSLRQVRQ